MKVPTIEDMKVVREFANIPDVQIQWLIDQGETLDLEEGDILFNVGEPVVNSYIILEGRLRICAVQSGKAKELRVLDAGLQQLFKVPRPRIAVCGLNPHAGESGHLGTEEQRIIKPALNSARDFGLDVRGPYPADTVFVPRNLDMYDAVLAMYHDQGLPVLKHAGFGAAVNVTLGLPIVRTSVDHGTALDLAGTGRADAGSLQAAIRLAASLSARPS